MHHLGTTLSSLTHHYDRAEFCPSTRLSRNYLHFSHIPAVRVIHKNHYVSSCSVVYGPPSLLPTFRAHRYSSPWPCTCAPDPLLQGQEPALRAARRRFCSHSAVIEEEIRREGRNCFKGQSVAILWRSKITVLQ